MPTRRIPWAAGCRTWAWVVLGAGALAAAEGQPADRARALMRQEAAARARQQAAQLAQVRALPNPPPAPLAVAQPVDPAPLMAVEAADGDAAGDDDAPGPAAAVRVYTEQAFDFYLLGGFGTTDRWRTELHQGLEREVGFLATSRGLTPAERTKLLLAGKGDVKRHFDRIDAKRKEFAVLRRDVAKARTFLMELHTLGRETRSGVWGHGSLFSKVLKTIGDRKSGRT